MALQALVAALRALAAVLRAPVAALRTFVAALKLVLLSVSSSFRSLWCHGVLRADLV